MELQRLIGSAAAFDLSWSLTDQMQEQRALVGWWSDTAPYQELKQMAIAWGMHPPMVEQWLAEGKATAGVALTTNLDYSSLRLYTHNQGGAAPDKLGQVVYRGYKALADGQARVDEYCHCGDLREADNLTFAKDHSQYPHWLDQVIEQTPDDTPLMFVRINNSGRQSWLVTVRHADLDAGMVAGDHYKGRKLLHLAGGIDASKGFFDTFYIASSPNEITSFLHKAMT